jgi:hypothetical protein
MVLTLQNCPFVKKKNITKLCRSPQTITLSKITLKEDDGMDYHAKVESKP